MAKETMAQDLEMTENTALMILQEIVLAVFSLVVFGGVMYLGWRVLSRLFD